MKVRKEEEVASKEEMFKMINTKLKEIKFIRQIQIL